MNMNLRSKLRLNFPSLTVQLSASTLLGLLLGDLLLLEFFACTAAGWNTLTFAGQAFGGIRWHFRRDTSSDVALNLGSKLRLFDEIVPTGPLITVDYCA